MAEVIRVGLVGFGMAGRVFHAPLISSVEGLELAAVVERHSDHAAERYPGITTCRSLDDILADSSLGLIVVATPTGTHFDVARQVIEAGKHAVVDKPVAVRSTEIAELIALARKQGTLLMPFQNRRLDADSLTAQQILREGTLGRVVHMESRMDRWLPGATRTAWKNIPEQGGGILLDLGVHLVDLALTFFGKPEGVSAEVGRERDGEGADDSFTIRLRYPGLGVTLASNMLSTSPGPRFLLRGTRGNFRKFGLDPQEAALNKITRITAPDWGREDASQWGTLQTIEDGALATRTVETLAGDYRRFYEGARETLLGRSAVPVKAADAWRNARVLEWAQMSSTQRCEIACNWEGEPH
ncbi:MAG TPA: Gfo/Idh/MocA family oxidoreductase [Terracidiphilus sp.]|jgi:predicted dehydrogenase